MVIDYNFLYMVSFITLVKARHKRRCGPKEKPQQALPGEQLAQGEACRVIAEEEGSKERNGDQLPS